MRNLKCHLIGSNKGWEKIKLNITANPKNISKVLVLQGGVSEEKEVSDSTAESCIEALERINLVVDAVSAVSYTHLTLPTIFSV